MFDKILVPLDGSALAERALPYAARIARATHGSILLLHVMSSTETQHRLEKSMNAAVRLEQLVEELRAAGVDATTWTMPGHAADVIVDAADPPRTDLVVMSTHGRGGLGRWLFGSVAEDVLRRALVPVLLVPASADRAWPTDRPLKLVVPLDGSETSEAALPIALAFRQALDGDVTFVRVVEPTAAPSLGFNPDSMSLERVAPTAGLDQAQAYLEEIASQSRGAAPTTGVLVDVGDPAATVASVVRQEQADAIVMATHGRTGLARITIGSVALAILHRAHVPVLLIRPVGMLRQEADIASPTSGAHAPGTTGL